MSGAVLAFDIETVPDLDGARRLLGLEGEDDAAVAEALAARQRARRGNDMPPAHLQRVVAIAVAFHSDREFRVLSLGTREDGEAELVRQFFGGIEKYHPVLVSWNGSGFDLPVLHWRALVHGIAAPRYWDTGQRDRDSKWDHYLGRYQFRHTDLMDVLGLYNGRNWAPLDEVAQLCGLPGKLGMDGSQVAGAFARGEIDAIRAYCETDTLNTYLLWLRFQRLRGELDEAGLAAAHDRVRAHLAEAEGAHWREFLDLWPA